MGITTAVVVVPAGVEVDIVVRRAILPRMDIKPARSTSSSRDRAGISKVGSSSSGLRDPRRLLRLRTLEFFLNWISWGSRAFNSRRFFLFSFFSV